MIDKPTATEHKAHFICQNGMECEADVEHIWNTQTGTANLKCVPHERNEHSNYMFPVSSIPYSSKPMRRTWHWAIACHVKEEKSNGRSKR